MVATCYHMQYHQQHNSYTHIFVTWCFNHHRFCVSIIYFITGWYIKIHWRFIGISCLAQDVIVLFSKSSHTLLKSNKLLLKVCRQFLPKPNPSRKTTHFFGSYAHTICAGLEMVVCDLASFHAVYFIAMQVIGTPLLLFRCTNPEISCFLTSWKHPCWGVTERFLDRVCICEFLFLFFPPLYICFCNTELPCCIAIVYCLGVAYHHQFEFWIITWPDSTQNTGHSYSPLLCVAWHFNAVFFNSFLRYHYYKQNIYA